MQQQQQQHLGAALRAALAGTGPAGVLVLGPSGSGKTQMVRACIADAGCRMQYGNALTDRGRAYFAAMDSGDAAASILDFFAVRAASASASAPPVPVPAPGAQTVLVVDDLDALADDAKHGLDGLLKLLPAAPRPQKGGGANNNGGGANIIGGGRRVCVCIATSLHASNKRMLDLYRRCVVVRVSAAAPAQGKALYRLAASMLSSAPPTAAAAAGLSEPDRVTLGLLLHENIELAFPMHARASQRASDHLGKQVHHMATADAVCTLPHQAQSWHLSELAFLLRTLGAAPPPPPPTTTTTTTTTSTSVRAETMRFTKLLTRCSTESGTRSFLTDMCFRQGCSWSELRARLVRLEVDYAAAAAARPPGGRRANAPGPAKHRMEWLMARLRETLTPTRACSEYAPELGLAEVRRMYRCMHAETGSMRPRAAAATAAAAAGGSKRRRTSSVAAAAPSPRQTRRRRAIEQQLQETEEQEEDGNDDAEEEEEMEEEEEEPEEEELEEEEPEEEEQEEEEEAAGAEEEGEEGEEGEEEEGVKNKKTTFFCS